MKQVALYVAVAAALLLLPGGTDVAELEPAQLVYVRAEGRAVIVRTDVGNEGRGNSLEESFADLENTTSGKVFLDTADYLLVNREAERLVPGLKRWLKADCLICSAESVEDLLAAAEYLDAHSPTMQLKDWREQRTVLQVLTESEERFCLNG